MDKITYFQIDLVPILALIIIYVDSTRRLKASHLGMLRAIMLMLIGVLSCNAASWALDGLTMPWVNTALWIVNLVYFTLCVVVAYVWLLYICTILFSDWHNYDIRYACAVAAIPMFVFLIMLALTPRFGLVFSISEDNVYSRGRFILVQQAISLGYLIAGSVLALIARSKEYMPDKRRYCMTIASFVFLPAIGGVLQIVAFGSDLVWPCTTAGFIYMYINLQHMQILLDSLTGLNNRSSLHQFMQNTQKNRSEPWYFILIDINGFKRINNRFGHLAGDEVLRDVADMLRNFFDHSEAYLSRYGGDEFAIILFDCDNDDMANDIIDALKEEIVQLGKRCRMPVNLSVSAGFSRCEGTTPAEQVLIDTAKGAMRQDKLRSIIISDPAEDSAPAAAPAAAPAVQDIPTEEQLLEGGVTAAELEAELRALTGDGALDE